MYFIYISLSLFFLENQSPVLEYKTLSGILKAKQVTGERIEIDLPAYESTSAVSIQYLVVHFNVHV